VVALFHVLEKEIEWRRARGQLEGFETMKSSKPLVAVGADHPLEDDILMADYFRKKQNIMEEVDITTDKISSDGLDGLAGVHTSVRPSSPLSRIATDDNSTLIFPLQIHGRRCFNLLQQMQLHRK